MSTIKEIEEYRKFTTPAELHKAVNTLKGIVAGITTDRKISEDEVNELSHWWNILSRKLLPLDGFIIHESDEKIQ